MADGAYESVLCVKNEVFVYKIPPRPSNRGYRASEWKLDAPDWTGRLRVVSVGKDLFIKLEDKTSGELFAQCPVEEYPGVAVEAVMDSSRYFVIRIKDPSGKSAFIGIGFADRSDSFDLNVALQDHFKWLKQEQEAKKASTELTCGPKLDLGFKAGQTITLNIGNKKSDAGGTRSKAKPCASNITIPPPPSSGGSCIKLPPPSGLGGGHIVPPGGSMGSVLGSAPMSLPSQGGLGAGTNLDLLLDLAPSPSQPSAPGSMVGGAPVLAPTQLAPSPSQPSAPGSMVGGAPVLAPTQLPSKPSGGDLWGDFSGTQKISAPPASNSSTGCSNTPDWVQF